MPEPSAEQRSRRRAGAPLRFLGLTLGLWIGVRVAVASSLVAQVLGGAADGRPEPAGRTGNPRLKYVAHAGGIARLVPGSVRRLDRVPIIRRDLDGTWSPEPVTTSQAFATAAASLPIMTAASAGADRRVSVAAANTVSASPHEGRDRWSASAWLFWRAQGGGRSLGSGSQLGGSQAGARIERALGRVGPGRGLPLSGYARVTTALRGPMAPEAAIGVAVRPLSGRVPVIIGIERRFAFDRNGRNAFALVAAGGLNPTRVIGTIAAEGYAQAGMVGLWRRDPFIDGRLSLTAPLGRGKTTRAGVSLSGGAQPGAARLDIGPAFETRLPLGRVRPRLTVEWRQRIAGKALPGSGVAVTLANDF